MKVNLNQSFVSYDKTELCDEQEVCRFGKMVKEKKPVMMADELAKHLYLGTGLISTDKREDADEKYKAYLLSRRINDTKTPIELSVEECALIKKVSLVAFNPGAYGQIIDLIEGRK